MCCEAFADPTPASLKLALQVKAYAWATMATVCRNVIGDISGR